ncbi:DUF5990 family protein [Brevundimonas sp.]|uniref:DUF5990 family protein n=1 Tax=Brevundimonas sp. TaxID=1871086 RepID=UPI00121A2F6A|nr:DUF5990 family protein [Brevundimonas sp.]TAJ64983.1 MAG: hypothetical protein EPO49_04245 [Brevundimonas sp.]
MADTVTLRLIIDDPVPGVRYSLQKDDMPFELRTAGDGPIAFEIPITLQPDGRMTGPFVRREGPVRRFVYIRIGTSAGDHAAAWSRRAKIDIHDIPKALLVPDALLEVHLPGRGKDGSPACATVRPAIGWRPV